MTQATEPRLLWITDRYPPLKGGMAVSAARQTAGLRKAGWTVDVLAFTEVNPGPSIRPEPREGGTDYYLARTNRPDPGGRLAWLQVTLNHRKQPYTHMIGFGAARPGFLAVTYGAWLGLPSLVLVRGNDFDQDWFDPGRGFWVREALGRADLVGAVSSEMADRIKKLFPDRDVRFVPNGVDGERFGLLPSDRRRAEELRGREEFAGRRIVGLFGELKYKKGLHLWLGALRDADLMDRIGLLIVGRRIEPDVEQILDDPTLAPPQVRLPYALRDDLAGLYAACDYVALPSLYEGLPNVLLEAMAAGVVPIVSNAGAMAEIVRDGETGFVFLAGDRGATAEAAFRAMNLEEKERRLMGSRARDFILQNYSDRAETRNLIDLLSGLSAHGSGEPVSG